MNRYKDIENIIFDLGGVIIDTNFELTYKAFKQLGVNSPAVHYQQAKENQFFLDLEKGLITPTEFRNKIKSFLKKDIQDEKINSAWNAMLLTIPDERIQILNKLKTRFNLYLLSNTNELHYENFTKSYPGIFNLEFSTVFVKTYYSHILHMRKPDSEIFDYVINDAQLIPEKTLFVDDLLLNIEAAKQHNFETIHLSINMDISDLFEISNQ